MTASKDLAVTIHLSVSQPGTERECHAPEQKQPSLNGCNQSKLFSIPFLTRSAPISRTWLCPYPLLPLISSLSAYSPLPWSEELYVFLIFCFFFPPCIWAFVSLSHWPGMISFLPFLFILQTNSKCSTTEQEINELYYVVVTVVWHAFFLSGPRHWSPSCLKDWLLSPFARKDVGWRKLCYPKFYQPTFSDQLHTRIQGLDPLPLLTEKNKQTNKCNIPACLVALDSDPIGYSPPEY